MNRPARVLSLIGLIAADSLPAQATRVRSVEATLRVGSGQDALFGQIGLAVPLPGGGVAVLDRSDSRLIIMDSAGKVSGSRGRNGQGPGEFMLPALIGTRHDSIWVSDHALARITLFALNSRAVRTIQLPARGTSVLLEDGSTLMLPTLSVPSHDSVFSIHRTSADGRVLNAIVTDKPWRPRSYSIARGNNRWTVGSQPFDDQPLVAALLDGSGVVVVDRVINERTPRYTVTRLAIDGQSVFRTTHAYGPIPITGRMIDTMVNGITRQIPSGQESEAAKAEARRLLFRPAHLPTVTFILTGTDGSIWLARERILGEPQRWTILDASGRQAFDVVVPPTIQIKAVLRESFWAVEAKPDGAEELVRYRVR